MSPKVSIIIPAYNVEKYIGECLRSVLTQTFSAWEAIVIDDGSTDNTLEVLKRFDDERIKCFSQQNAGLSATRNRGVEVVQGEYILFLDSDDRLHEKTVEECYTLVQKYQIDAVTFDGYDFIEKNDTEQILKGGYFDRSNTLEEQCYSGEEFLEKEVFRKAVVVSAPLYFVKKEKLIAVPFLKDILHEDVLFHYQLMPLLQSIYYLPKKFYQRRLREGSIVHTSASLKSLKSYQAIICFLQDIYRQSVGKKKKIYLKIIQKNMMQVGKLGKRYLFGSHKEKGKGRKVLCKILNQGNSSLIVSKYLYFSVGFVYYLFADIKSLLK